MEEGGGREWEGVGGGEGGREGAGSLDPSATELYFQRHKMLIGNHEIK